MRLSEIRNQELKLILQKPRISFTFTSAQSLSYSGKPHDPPLRTKRKQEEEEVENIKGIMVSMLQLHVI
jgi:hypothetical protein